MEEQKNELQDKHRKRKALLILAGIALLVYVIYLVVSVFVSPDRRIQQIYLVPADAAFIIQSSHPVEDWKKFSHSEPWKTLRKAKTFEDISRQVETLDSVIHANKNLLSLVGERDMLVSIHKTKAADWDALFMLDMQKMSKLDLLKDQIELILRMTDFIVTHRTYQDTDIIEMRDPETRDILYAAFVENHFVASYTSRLVESAITARHSPVIGLDASFIECEKQVAGKGLFRIFVNYVNVPDFLTLYLGEKNEFIDKFSHSMNYGGLWLTINKEKIETKGYSLRKDVADPYVTALLNSGKRKMKVHEIMSGRTAFYTHIGLEDVLTFMKELEKVMAADDPSLYASYTESKNKIEKMFDISLEDHFLSWMSGELAVAQLEPGLLGREPERVLVVGAKDIKEARRQMDFIEKRIRKKTPVKIKTANYKEFEVKYVEMKGFFRLFFGGLFDTFEKPYYTYIDDYVVFSNQPSSLLSFIEDYEQKNLMKDDTGFKRNLNAFSNHSTLFLYADVRKFYPQLTGMMNAATSADLQTNKELLYSFPYWTLQLVGDYQSASLQYVMDYTPYFPEEYFIEDEDEFDNTIDENTETDKELMNELKQFYVEKFQGNVLREFFPEGALKSESEIKNGQRHGRYREYYENGHLRVRGKFSKNRPKGTWKFYTEDGKFERKEKF